MGFVFQEDLLVVAFARELKMLVVRSQLLLLSVVALLLLFTVAVVVALCEAVVVGALVHRPRRVPASIVVKWGICPVSVRTVPQPCEGSEMMWPPVGVQQWLSLPRETEFRAVVT